MDPTARPLRQLPVPLVALSVGYDRLMSRLLRVLALPMRLWRCVEDVIVRMELEGRVADPEADARFQRRLIALWLAAAGFVIAALALTIR